jgi:hypothetical protein
MRASLTVTANNHITTDTAYTTSTTVAAVTAATGTTTVSPLSLPHCTTVTTITVNYRTSQAQSKLPHYRQCNFSCKTFPTNGSKPRFEILNAREKHFSLDMDLDLGRYCGFVCVGVCGCVCVCVVCVWACAVLVRVRVTKFVSRGSVWCAADGLIEETLLKRNRSKP